MEALEAMTDETSKTMAGTTFRLMYRSRDRLAAPERDEELADLFAASRSNNSKRDITGALLLSGHWFVQVLEGAEDDVRSLFSRIEKDSRHDAVELLSAEPAEGRVFARWSMAKVAVDDNDIPLIARISEITPASSRRMTPAMTHLLEVMRGAITDPPGD